MKKTFVTTMPDQGGAFLKADQCLSRLQLNITRVSYNRAVDVHMLFIEVEGTSQQLQQATEALSELGYLQSDAYSGSVVLLQFELRDAPGVLLPVLELIHQFQFNISYISSQENGTGYQQFKMGLFLDDSRKLSQFVHEASLLCPVTVLDYDKSEKVIDNTVFYLSFANEISEKMDLPPEAKNQLIVNSNLIMQMLDERDSPPYKTFDYIGRFAGQMRRYRGEKYQPRITRYRSAAGLEMVLIEPPCGSNTCVLCCQDRLLFCDCGFACYREEFLAVCRALFENFDQRPKELFLTHGDVDHCGCVDLFDRVYAAGTCFENFDRERAGKPAFREENPLHAPYVRISKILSAYQPPQPREEVDLGRAVWEGGALLQRIEDFTVEPLHFEVYEGRGGHVRGEAIYIERTHRIAFTGDIYVNIKEFTKEQARFNRLAPYLMTSVDTDVPLARRERLALFDLLDAGHWQIFGGHGGVFETDIAE